MKLFILILLTFSLQIFAVEEDDTIFISDNESYSFPSGDNNTGDQPLIFPTPVGIIGIPERAQNLFPDGFYPLRDIEYHDCTLDLKRETVPEENGYDYHWSNNQQTYDVNGNLLSEYLDLIGDNNIVDGWDEWTINQFDENDNLINSKDYSIVTDGNGNNGARLLYEQIYIYTYDITYPKRINFLQIELLTYFYQADGTPNGTESSIYNAVYNYNFESLISSERWIFPKAPFVDIIYIYDLNKNLKEYQIVPSIQQLPRQFLSFSYGADQLLGQFSKGLKTNQDGAIISQVVTEFSYIPITPLASGFLNLDSSSSTVNDWTPRGKVDRQISLNNAGSPDPSSYCAGFEDYAWSTNGSVLNVKIGGSPYDPQQLCDEYQGVVDFVISFSGSCVD